ncbi:MAG: S1 RNA-binding domain-containing protein [Lachnospiraceae bacterium]|nr:S1 RNA-binding domain-containing protein [Lachnospiraceae bacterium]
MLKLGEKQKLKIVKKTDFGVYLSEGGDAERVLLPGAQVPEGTAVGTELEVFLYRDSEDRMIATVRTPLLVMGTVARLTVAQVTKVGAFLDWGLEKDLFLPFKQQTRKVAPGDRVLVSLYLDKSERLCATMNVYEALQSAEGQRPGDTVTGEVYLISDRFGAFVAVDDRISALIPRKEMYGDAQKVKVGDHITARIRRVLEDGRLELSVRDTGEAQRTEDAEAILDLLDSYEGALPFGDKASPEVILRETGMSKAQFKRAVGKLLKEGRIEIGEKTIRRK